MHLMVPKLCIVELEEERKKLVHTNRRDQWNTTTANTYMDVRIRMFPRRSSVLLALRWLKVEPHEAKPRRV